MGESRNNKDQLLKTKNSERKQLSMIENEKESICLNKLSQVIDLIIESLNSEAVIDSLSKELTLEGNGVCFQLPFGEKTAWGHHLIFWNHGRFFSLAISHSEYFECYTRLLDYFLDYSRIERFLSQKFTDLEIVGETSNEDHIMQNYSYWNIKEGRIGIQQSDRDRYGLLVTEIIFIPLQWLDQLSLPVFIN